MDLSVQLMELGSALAIGWLLGIIFDAYRAVRNVLHPKRFMTAVMDGLYWLVAVITAFSCLLFSNWAEMRFYIFLGIILGWISYYKFISQYVLLCLIKIMHCLIISFIWLRKVIIFIFVQPIGYILGIFVAPFRYGNKKFRQMRNNRKNN